jgi:hypothetical protein
MTEAIMSVDTQALLASIGNFKDKTKLAVEDANTRAVVQTEVLIDEMEEEFQRQILELGAPAGGDFFIAVTEASMALPANEIDVGKANHYTKTVTANTALTVTNIPSAGRAATFILHITNGGAFTMSWWPNIRWAEGIAPALSTAGRDVIGFSTLNGGATWDGYLIGKDMKASV